jgi:chorismate mutase
MTVERWSPPADALAALRGDIGRVDAQLVSLIAERVRLARAVGDAKRALGLPTIDPPREAAVVRRAGELAREAALDDTEVREIFWRLIALSRRAQDGRRG